MMNFPHFFDRADSFGLGICNGCQMMSNLYRIIPGAGHWPRFVRNRSEQFEARLVMAEVLNSPSMFLDGMQGSMMPVVVAHGEGLTETRDCSSPVSYSNVNSPACAMSMPKVAPSEIYPFNPNGSELGLNGFSNEDGRFTIMMPHPERIFRSVQNSWSAPEWGEYSPWMRLFRNARRWIELVDDDVEAQSHGRIDGTHTRCPISALTRVSKPIVLAQNEHAFAALD